jgi:hypothetical protein
MEITDRFLRDDLIKHGILDRTENLNPNLTPKDLDNLLSGGTLLVEQDKKAILLSISDSKVKVNALNNDLLKHNNLSSAELLHLTQDNGRLYKPLADYGKIVNFGKDHFMGNKENEKTFFVVLENERGQTIFNGNDLEEKMKNFKIGDKVQINNLGVEKKEMNFELNGKNENIQKYDSTFSVSNSFFQNQKVKSSLFEINKNSKIVNEMDVSDLTLRTVNGHNLKESDIDRLKKGKSVKFDDGLEVQLSPKENNKFQLQANTNKLLVGSLLLDGGISFAIITAISLLKTVVKEQEKKTIENKYLNELQNLKGYLQQQAQKYPDDKKILSNINLVEKEIGSVNSIDPKLNKKAENTVARIDVYDLDISKEIQDKADRKREDTQKEERKSGGIGR